MTRAIVVRASLGVLLALAAGCASKRAPAKPKSNVSARAEAPAISAGPVSAAPANHCREPPAAVLNDAAVAELVARWRSAQQAHDFAAYAALYADHFAALVTDGASVARVDRRSWLDAHRPPPGLDSALSRAPLRVVLGAGGAQVTFGARQPANGGAHLPELFVVSTASGPKIAREAPARSAPSELSEHPGLWLADERFAVLSAAPEPAWAEGDPVASGDNTATSAVALNRLPKALRAWLGRPVRVLGAAGIVCDRRLQRFAIRATIVPDLPSAELWDGCGEDHPAPEAIAREVWRLSAAEGRSLVAEFSAPCEGALFALDPDQPAPVVAAPQPASAELGARALAAFRSLPEYARIEARFKAGSPGTEGAWEDREAKRSVWSLAAPERTPLVFVSVEAGAGCANFSASLSALWAVHEDGTGASLTLLAVPNAEDERRLTPRAVLDLGEAGGVSLLLGPDGAYAARSLLKNTTGGYRQTLLTSVPFFAGPC